MTEKPLVSIITPVLNLVKNKRVESFKNCLESVHQQTYANIEHIVVDGASTDGTIDILKKYTQNGYIQYISQKDSCLYEAMNTGIDISQGKYIAILNSDDFFHNCQAVELSVDALEKSNADFSYADCDITRDGKFLWLFKGNRERFISAMPFSHQTMFTKRQVMLDFNKFNLKYRMAADYDFIIRIMLGGCTSVYIPKSISTFCLGGISESSYDKTKEDCANIFIEHYSHFYTFSSWEEAYYLFDNKNVNLNFIKSFYKMAKYNKFTNFDWKITTFILLSFCHIGVLRFYGRIYLAIRKKRLKSAIRMELIRNFLRWAASLQKHENIEANRNKN